MALATASTTRPPAVAEPRKRNYARIAEQTWIWSIVGYSLLRFVVAWGAFSDHGANVWVFGLIDVGTAWPYAKSVAEVCKRAARSEWRGLPVPLALAVTTFFAPYAYLWFAAGEMPGGMRVGMIICVSVLLLAASAGVIGKTRALRAQARAAASVESPAGATSTAPAAGVVSLASVDGSADAVLDLRGSVPQTELLIDLTGDETVLERPIVNG